MSILQKSSGPETRIPSLFICPSKPNNFCMPWLSKDHNLSVTFFCLYPGLPDLRLKSFYNRTGCFNYRNIIFFSKLICFRRFSMSPYQDLAVFKCFELLVID